LYVSACFVQPRRRAASYSSISRCLRQADSRVVRAVRWAESSRSFRGVRGFEGREEGSKRRVSKGWFGEGGKEIEGTIYFLTPMF
jgi:hypothetical protein